MSIKFNFPANYFFQRLRPASASPSSCWRPDVTIQVGENDLFPAHRLVLAAYSPIFDRIFYPHNSSDETSRSSAGTAGGLTRDSGLLGGDGESGIGSEVVPISPDDVSVASFEWILAAMYGGAGAENLDLEISVQNVYELHSAANYLEIGPLAERCADFMAANLTIENVYASWTYANRNFLGSDRLLSACEAFIGANFGEFCQREEIMGLKLENFLLWMDFLWSRNNFLDLSENQHAEVHLCWLYHDWSIRYQFVDQILSNINWNEADKRCEELSIVKSIKTHRCSNDAETVAESKIMKNVFGLKNPEIQESSAESSSHAFIPDSKELMVVTKAENGGGQEISIFDLETSLYSTPAHPVPSASGGPRASSEIMQIHGLFKIDRSPFAVARARSDPTVFNIYTLDRRGRSMSLGAKLGISFALPDGWAGRIASYVEGGHALLCLYFEDKDVVIRSFFIFSIAEIQERVLQGGDSFGDEVHILPSLEPTHSVGEMQHSRPHAVRKSAVALTPQYVWFIAGEGVSDVIKYDLARETWELGWPIDCEDTFLNAASIVDRGAILVVGFLRQKSGAFVQHVRLFQLDLKDPAANWINLGFKGEGVHQNYTPSLCATASYAYIFYKCIGYSHSNVVRCVLADRHRPESEERPDEELPDALRSLFIRPDHVLAI